jgi:hypothetical protein
MPLHPNVAQWMSNGISFIKKLGVRDYQRPIAV